jgi:hypothetical protein
LNSSSVLDEVNIIPNSLTYAGVDNDLIVCDV